MAAMDVENSCVPTDLIPYVLSFLEQCGLEKSAKALRKEFRQVRAIFWPSKALLLNAALL